jgi:hypothetical protein
VFTRPRLVLDPWAALAQLFVLAGIPLRLTKAVWSALGISGLPHRSRLEVEGVPKCGTFSS